MFADHRAEIIQDCNSVLAECTSRELKDYVAKVEEALDAAEGGHLSAAQALAAAVFDTVLRVTFEPEKISGYYKKVKREIQDKHENADLSEMRSALVYLPALVALETFDPTKGEPVPSGFNRHASAHAVGQVQYTPANAVIALALATSLIREAHQAIVESPS